MTEEEAAHVLAIFTAAHPKVTLTPSTVQMWFQSALSTTPFELGQKIALDLVAAEKGFPTVAGFNSYKRRLREQEAAKNRKPPEPIKELPPDETYAWLDQCREKIGYPRKDRNPS